MKVLVHYTVIESVFNCFSREGTIRFEKIDRIEQVADFYKKYYRIQETRFFLVCYSDLHHNKREYTAGKITYNGEVDNYLFTSVAGDVCDIICRELGLGNASTYERDIFYKVYTIEDDFNKFMNIKKQKDLNKIRLKFFSWDELLSSYEILFNEICNIIFSRDNVLKVASTYKPNTRYTSKQLKKKYVDALKAIGFIRKDGINVNFKTLHGDIGEFVMHIMLSQFLREESVEKYIYPKLVFKSSPNMPIYGNDGTIYVKDKKEIYYLEAKFYSDFKQAVEKAVESLKNHNEDSHKNISHNIELFRNIKTDEMDEIIEINEETSENLVIFVMCDDHTQYNDILEKAQKNKKLEELKKNYKVLLFVLPVLSKTDFLKYFKKLSEEVWEESNEE